MINVLLNTNNSNYQLNKEIKESDFRLNLPIYNKNDLNSFINIKNSFENLSFFSYYPYKLFQEVLNE